MTSPLPPEPSETPAQQPSKNVGTPERLILRRAPKVAPFLVAGFLIGAVIGSGLVIFFGAPQDYTYGSTMAYFGAYFGIGGLFIATIIWLILNHRSLKRRTEMTAREVDNIEDADVAMSNYERAEALKHQKSHHTPKNS